MRLCALSTCSLNQWALDFAGNLERTRRSIYKAKADGARYRLGPELELTSYGCEDHFHEPETERYAWEALDELLRDEGCGSIVIDVGMPVWHRDVCYNCRVFCLDGKILLIRPKISLADDGNYREPRWFRAWHRDVEQYRLPPSVAETTGQQHVPFGEAVLELADACIGAEACEELFTLDAPHVRYALDGVDILGNGSGSHTQLRKLDLRIDLIRSAAKRGGGVYLYANQIGCDGGRLYYDGCSMIAVNGELVSQGRQFFLDDEVEVLTSIVDLDDVRSFRNAIASRSVQAAEAKPVHRIFVNFKVCFSDSDERIHRLAPNSRVDPRYHSSEEEIALGPACWLWDYLRRSGAIGFLLPLSGGADSSSTAALVGSMCQLIVKAAASGSEVVLRDIRRITGKGEAFTPTDAMELASMLLTTCFMGSKGNSSAETRLRAKTLADEIGTSHVDFNIDEAVQAFLRVFAQIFPSAGKPQFKAYGGSYYENQALQNLQARVRMVFAYMLAMLTPWTRGRSGFMLVLGSSNVDEGLRGYLTKYDCSSADINPIGGISKTDLKRFLRWGSRPVEEGGLGYSKLLEVVEAPPTAELEPLTSTYVQTDEADMGMTYEELSWFGRLRKIERCGPQDMFLKLLRVWDHLKPSQVSQKVKFFFRMYSINRHKMTTLTPSYHAENYSPEDNRFDLRQFLYPTQWNWPFQRIDALVEKMEPKSSDAPEEQANENSSS
eukprot:CAMPEP_0113954142 /NCGR_PEP_ID=MMETSP0011_2-20120614/295_1 /TAXON_ID=101924 /ORGANISM="Rhodosorus marinus" /LENGTH=721 /DNA_ID=CAMNT_0000963051 /DNA_START=272 /DNA_END=2437 /DNA_ORIENTATION=- /assembly_acc=CAM_ASM_000156